MIAILCSKRMHSFLSPEVSHPAGVPFTERWNAHMFYFMGRKCLVFMDKETLYCTVVLDVLKKDLANPAEAFVKMLVVQMRKDFGRDRVMEKAVRAEFGDAVFLPTDNDRSVMRCINDVMQRIKYYDHTDDPFANARDHIDRNLNNTPIGVREFRFSSELMRRKLENMGAIQLSP